MFPYIFDYQGRGNKRDTDRPLVGTERKGPATVAFHFRVRNYMNSGLYNCKIE